MENKYVDFIADEHLLKCIENLHASYMKAKAKISKKKFYNNKMGASQIDFLIPSLEERERVR